MAAQWTYTAPAHILPAKPFKTDKQVKVCPNNQVATISIPKQKENQGFEELCAFMNAHPLNGAYFNTLPQLYPAFISEWWYTCNSNDANTVISGTIDQGKRTIAIDQELISVVLDLPNSGTFSPIPTKDEARASLSVVGFNKPKGPILYSAFTPRWKFIISGIIRSLGGKSGSTGEMNEFETHILSSFITGANINYAALYFNELLKLTNESHRIFNVPFIRLLSLCFENWLGESVYASFSTNLAEIPVPVLTSKVFNHVIVPDEVPITPSMQQWIDNPHGVHSTDSHESGGQSTNSGTPCSKDKSSDNPSSSNPSSNSLNAPTSISSPPSSHNLAQVESSSMELDVLETPSCAVVQSTSSLLEFDVPLTTKSQPEPRIDILEQHVTTTVETPTVCIEDDVPLLDSNTPFIPPLSMPTPIYTTTPEVVHLPTINFLHPLPQVVNTSVISQTEVQISNTSVSSDIPSYNLLGCEGIPTSTPVVDDSLSNNMIRMTQECATHQSYDPSSIFPEIGEDFQSAFASHDLAYNHSKLSGDVNVLQKLHSDLFQSQPERCEGQTSIPTSNPTSQSQSVSSKTLDDVLLAITSLSEQIQTEHNNNMKELEQMKNLVSNLEHKVDVMGGTLTDRLDDMLQTLSHLADNVKKGEKSVDDDKSTASGVRTSKDKNINNNNNNNENINVDDINDSIDGDGVEGENEGEPEILHVQPLATLPTKEQVDVLYKGVVEKIRKRERGEGGSSDDVPLFKRPKKFKRMAVRKVDLHSEDKVKDFDDDDDDAPISTIIRRVTNEKGKSGGSSSGMQTETQHQESNQSTSQKEVKEEEEEYVIQDPVTQEIAKAAAEAGMSPEKYMRLVKQNEAKFKEDMELAKRINRQQVLSGRLKSVYVRRRIEEGLIMSCAFLRDPHNRILIDYRLSNRVRKTTFVDQLYLLGFVEWKYIARFIRGMVDKKLKEDIMNEIILLVEAAHDLGLLDDAEYGTFCVTHNIKRNKKPLGLMNERMPEGLRFVENAYVKQKNFEGFCYRDDKGNECFQSISSLHVSDLYHLLALLNLCKSEQSQPFRKKLIRCLFYHLGELDKVPELKGKCERIRKEHRANEKANLEEVERIERSRSK